MLRQYKVYFLMIGFALLVQIPSHHLQELNALPNDTIPELEEAIEIGETSKDTVYHGNTARDTFTITNVGNTVLNDILLRSDDFIGISDPSQKIFSEGVTFYPVIVAELLPEESITVYVNIYVPFGKLAQDYQGKITVRDDDGYPEESINLMITVLPQYDVDIANNQQNLVDNVMTLAQEPGNTTSGCFRLINPNSEAWNVDPDTFGNTHIDGFTYYLNEDLTDWIFDSIKVDLPQTGLISGGYSDVVLIAYIDASAFAGSYSGGVTIIGDTSGIEVSRDSFELRVFVAPLEAISLGSITVDTVYHGEYAYSDFTVTNTGNADLDNIVFEATDLCDTLGNMIVGSNIDFYPAVISQLLVDSTKTVVVNVYVPFGTYADIYSGIITVKDDDGYPLEVAELSVTVLPTYDVDIADTEEDLSGNKMTLEGSLGEITERKTFLTVNPSDDWQNYDPDIFGNANYDIEYSSTDLIFGKDTIPSDSVTIIPSLSYLPSGRWEVCTLYVRIPDDTGLAYGKYTGIIRAVADTGGIIVSSDSFNLELNIKPFGIVEFEDTLTEFFVWDNKPNPFKKETSISYFLPECCDVNIVVYNLSGCEIRTVIDERQDRGLYTIIWDGRDDKGKQVPEGNYFLLFKAGDFEKTSKMVILG